MNTEIQQLTDQCVKCGLCLTKCPTYQLSANESESPRGRIAIIQALNSGQLEPTEKGQAHLEHCLQCMACESVCPAEVPYGKIIDAGMALVEEKRPKRLLTSIEQIIANLYFRHSRLRALFVKVLWLYQKSGLQALLRKSALLTTLNLSNLDRLIPNLDKSARLCEINPAKVTKKSPVYFHLGCVSDNFDKGTNAAAVRLLTDAGFEVVVPKRQNCCGALQQHSGKRAEAKRLKEETTEIFTDATSIISTTTGCIAFLRDQGLPVYEIMSFLIEHQVPLRLKQLEGINAIYFQAPCTHKNVLKTSGLLKEYIKAQLPSHIRLIEDTDACCGAAGTQMLKQPALAIELGKKKLSLIDEASKTLVLSTNIGCALHLRAIPEMSKLKVMHPINVFEVF